MKPIIKKYHNKTPTHLDAYNDGYKKGYKEASKHMLSAGQIIGIEKRARAETIKEVLKIIDEEIKNEEEAKKNKAKRYWTYEKELRLLKRYILEENSK